MDTERMIRNLEKVEEDHKNDKVFTGQLNIADMVRDVRKRLEELKPYEDTDLTPQQIKDMQFCLREKSRECGELRREIQELKNKKNDGWIPVEERLPEEWEKVIVWYEYFRYGDYNRMYETYGIGWQYGGHWAGDVSGTKARCIAWHPLPEPCRLKQPETCKYTGGSCCWPIDQCSDCPNNPERSENDK